MRCALIAVGVEAVEQLQVIARAVLVLPTVLPAPFSWSNVNGPTVPTKPAVSGDVIFSHRF